MSISQMGSNEFKQVIAQYETEKQTLQTSINNLEKDHIIKNERLAQLKTNLVSSYGTDDPEELKKILEKNVNELAALKLEIETLV